MNIYVIRYSQLIDEEYECGNFDCAFESEAEAVKVMLADMESTKRDCADGIDEVDSSVTMGVTNVEHCSVEVTRAGSGIVDEYDWWIDKLTICMAI